MDFLSISKGFKTIFYGDVTKMMKKKLSKLIRPKCCHSELVRLLSTPPFLPLCRLRGGGRCKILGVLMTFPCYTFLQTRNIGVAKCLYLTYFQKYWGCYSTPQHPQFRCPCILLGPLLYGFHIHSC